MLKSMEVHLKELNENEWRRHTTPPSTKREPTVQQGAAENLTGPNRTWWGGSRVLHQPPCTQQKRMADWFTAFQPTQGNGRL